MVYQASISNGKVPESPMKVRIKDDKFSSLHWQFLIQSIEKVPGFWKIHAYKIGGQVFNLDEIEHGVLRANRGKNWHFIKFIEK